MRQAEKIKQALPARQTWWDDMLSDVQTSSRTKMYNGRCFIKPGSQNRKKGASAPKVKR